MFGSSHLLCSFCGKSFKSSSNHDCMTKVFHLFNSATQENKDPKALFNNIDNLVFQGGGIKGIGYLGVLFQLLEENPDILKNSKRFAGTSAGSIVALYLALGLDPHTQIKELLSRSYSELLDDGLALKVAINVNNWFGGYKYKVFKTKDIVLTAIKRLKEMEIALQDPANIGKVEEQIASLFGDLMAYYSSKFGATYGVFMKTIGKSFAKDAARWLVSLLRAEKEVEEQILLKETVVPTTKSFFEKIKTIVKPLAGGGTQTTTEHTTVETSTVDTTTVEEEPITVITNFDSILDQALHHAVDQMGGHEEKKDDGKGILPNTMQTLATVGAAINFAGKATETNPLGPLGEVKDNNLEFYKEQTENPLVETADANELEGQVLHYALGEMLWFIFLSQIDASGLKQEVGLFTGEKIKEELIEGAIKMKFEALGILVDYKPGFTFRELAAFKDSKGNKLFKPFYMCSFNTSTLRTEVFSYEHSPEVVIADAVRASMSIPVFFTPVMIKEYGVPRKIYYDHGEKSEEIRYMDGGILDNYPLWIFDDLKYCLDEFKDWKPAKKFAIANPRTLGFRILDKEQIDIYTQPYYDTAMNKMKRINSTNYKSSFSYFMGSMLYADFDGTEENRFIRGGESQRSVFVDSLGISTISFSLSEADKNRLIDSGRQAVLNYKVRAQKNFAHEGEKYI